MKCSVCGEILTAQEEIPATGHTEETIPGKAATCTETGLTDGVKCSVCGEILTAQEEIPALGHTEETVPGKAATCTETGLTDGVKCTVCGEILVAQEEIPTLNHRIIDTKAEEATCVHLGYTAGKYCLDCAKYISGHEEIPGELADHKLVKIYAADPTCYREGQTAGFMCTNKGCTYREGGEVLKKVPHTYNEWTENGDGTHTAECSVCKEAGQPYTWPTSEDCTFEWVIVSVADCENDGLKEYKCSVCGYVSET
ncbi:MAG: hypothetical protein PUF31_08595, partial [Oscillospiraceae bacterium]|nr:hypothetical protein [Oscillospiraceae bacterium]